MSIYENTPAYCERAAHIAEKAMRIRKRKDLKNILASKLVLKDLERSNAMKKHRSLRLLHFIPGREVHLSVQTIDVTMRMQLLAG